MSKKKIIVEVPHRISGFFEIVDQVSSIPEKIGSRGAGFNLNAIGRTEIICEPLDSIINSECLIRINGEELNKKAETTYSIFNKIKKLIKNQVRLEISHFFDLPVGCGYGASGSGALGAIYGLNEILNLKLSKLECGRIAHVAEVENRTGLGTICGQLGGGLCILKEPGYPCSRENIDFPSDVVIYCGTFGMIHTKSILTDPVLNQKIKQAGSKALIKLLDNPNLETFMRASMEFVNETKIMEILKLDNTKNLMDELNDLNIIGASMNQLGRSIYAICEKKDENDVKKIFKSKGPNITIMKTSINNKGPEIIHLE
ncbi:MAG: pantoate kinase [Promethearchaeota archaeon]